MRKNVFQIIAGSSLALTATGLGLYQYSFRNSESSSSFKIPTLRVSSLMHEKHQVENFFTIFSSQALKLSLKLILAYGATDEIEHGISSWILKRAFEQSDKEIQSIALQLISSCNSSDLSVLSRFSNDVTHLIGLIRTPGKYSQKIRQALAENFIQLHQHENTWEQLDQRLLEILKFNQIFSFGEVYENVLMMFQRMTDGEQIINFHGDDQFLSSDEMSHMMQKELDNKSRMLYYVLLIETFMSKLNRENVVLKMPELCRWLGDLILFTKNQPENILFRVLKILHVLSDYGLPQSYLRDFVPFLTMCAESKTIPSLSCLSSTILASVDISDPSWIKYPPNVILVHPLERKKLENVTADVVFIHGVSGQLFKTWRCGVVENDESKDSDVNKITKFKDSVYGIRSFWPRDWLSMELPHVRILTVGYDSKFLKVLKPHVTSDFSVTDQAQLLASNLLSSKVGSRPIIWISHSLGGILSKSISLHSAESTEESVRELFSKTGGFVFLSTPHKGTPWAEYLKYLGCGIRISEISPDSSWVEELNHKFIELVASNHMECINFAEDAPYKLFKLIPLSYIIPKENCDLGYGKFLIVNRNHSNICKPVDRKDPVYHEVMKLVESVSSYRPNQCCTPNKMEEFKKSQYDFEHFLLIS